MSFVLSHSRLGFCWWDLLALVALVVVVVFFVVKRRSMKKHEKELEDELSALYANDSLKEEQSV